MPTRLSLFALAAVAAAPGIAPAALDPEPTAPYVWRVAIRFDPHPLLTPPFRAQVVHDVRAALQPWLGQVGRVEVVDLLASPDDRRSPLGAQFADKGWAALESEEFRRLTGAKTSFLRVAVRDGLFRLEARQHDGSTGLASPAVRVRETAAADTVGRVAGMMLGREFGPVGTVEKIENEPERVRVVFRGGALPGFDRFVKSGDVFAVAVVREQTVAAPAAESGTKGKAGARAAEPVKVRVGQPREFTLLRAEEAVADGACRCRILTRFANPFPSARGVLGYRCLKLPTVDAPVQLRVVDQDGRPQVPGQLLQVRAVDTDFTVRTDSRDSLELKDGLFRSARPLRNVACVVVALGTAREERFPVPVLGEGPLTVRFNVNAEDAARAAFERDCLDLHGRVAESRTAQLALARALSQLIVKGRNGEALERAENGLKSLAAADAELSAELERLRALPGAGDPVPADLLNASDAQLKLARVARGAVEQRAAELKEAVAKSNDPVRFEKEFRAKELSARIRQLVEAGEVPEALDLYDQLYDLTRSDETKEQKKRLAAEWEPKTDDQRAAREYVAGKWRQAFGLAAIKAAVDPLGEAADTLVKSHDRLGLRNLISSFEPAYAKLKEVLDTLDPNAEIDRQAVKDLQAVSQSLRKIEEKAREELKKIEGVAPKEAAP